MRACSFTGHRRIAPTHKKALSGLLLRAINYAYENGCREFCCGGAIGFDTEAARAVLLFRVEHPDIKLILLLPCQDQDEGWSDLQRDSYDYILRAADEIRYTSDFYHNGCMKIRNQALVDSCDILIAYLSNTKSGAGQTVRMAEKQGKTVYNLYPTLENI